MGIFMPEIPLLFLKWKWFGYCYVAILIFLSNLKAASVCILGIGIDPQQALKVRSGRLGGHVNTERWQVFVAVGNWGIDNYIIVSHSVPMWTGLNVISNCRFSLYFLGNLIQPVLRHHERGASAQSALRGEFLFRHRQSVVDLAIVVCDTYW